MCPFTKINPLVFLSDLSFWGATLVAWVHVKVISCFLTFQESDTIRHDQANEQICAISCVSLVWVYKLILLHCLGCRSLYTCGWVLGTLLARRYRCANLHTHRPYQFSVRKPRNYDKLCKIVHKNSERWMILSWLQRMVKVHVLKWIILRQLLTDYWVTNRCLKYGAITTKGAMINCNWAVTNTGLTLE